ncbi:UAA transporter [Tulasnella sp. 418]|nr:UAA transporter [Tulasnella sp. 418]
MINNPLPSNGRVGPVRKEDFNEHSAALIRGFSENAGQLSKKNYEATSSSSAQSVMTRPSLTRFVTDITSAKSLDMTTSPLYPRTPTEVIIAPDVYASNSPRSVFHGASDAMDQISRSKIQNVIPPNITRHIHIQETNKTLETSYHVPRNQNMRESDINLAIPAMRRSRSSLYQQHPGNHHIYSSQVTSVQSPTLSSLHTTPPLYTVTDRFTTLDALPASTPDYPSASEIQDLKRTRVKTSQPLSSTSHSIGAKGSPGRNAFTLLSTYINHALLLISTIDVRHLALHPFRLAGAVHNIAASRQARLSAFPFLKQPRFLGVYKWIPRLHSISNSTGMWLMWYFAFNLGLTLYNKKLLSQFPFPYTLTAVHALFSTLGCCSLRLAGQFTPIQLTVREITILSMFSILYTLNIAVSNVSLHLVTVPFHQVVRAATPLFTIVIAYMLTRNHGKGFLGVGWERLFSLMPVVVGVGFATYGEYQFTTAGLVLTLFGTFLAGLKTVITNLLQNTTKPSGGDFPHYPSSTGITIHQPVRSSQLKLHPLDLLYCMSPMALVQCIFYSHASGEMRSMRIALRESSTAGLWALAMNGCIAFGLNVVSLTANKKAGPLTMTVAANVKQVLTILLAVSIFDIHLSLTNSVGIVLTLIGGAWYAALELKEKRRRRRLSGVLQ